jgi:Glycosyltransferase family 87
MRARLDSPYALPALFAVIGAAFMGWTALTGFAWSDYDDEARGSVDLLLGGHVHGFLASAPVYGGSLLLRAPFAFVPKLWGGGELAVYRALAVPCLAAAVFLGTWVAGRMRAARLGPVAWGAALVVIVGNPVTLRALEMGHPEELLVAAMCVFAIVLAGARRPLLAAVVLGVAVAAKPWALLAVPVLILLAEGCRWRALGVTAAAAVVVVAPFIVADAGRATTTVQGNAHTSVIFQPWQAWWFLGHHGGIVRGYDGVVKPEYRTPPGWLSGVAHPLILLLSPLLTLAFWRRRRAVRFEDALALLALIFILRAMLDPWDVIYYVIPGLFALVTWEGVVRRRVPALSLVVSVLAWVTFWKLPPLVSPDAQSLFYLAWTVPVAAGLALRVFAPARFAALAGRLPRTASGGAPASASAG